MPKALAIVGLAVSVLLFVVFGLDYVTKFPFQKASPAMDIGFIICSAVLAYMSWNTLREQV
jgi:hypothetical protein